MMKKIPLLLLLCNYVSAQLYFLNQTIYTTLAAISPHLYQAIQTSDELIRTLNSDNITFILPNENAITNAISTGVLNFTNTQTSQHIIQSLIINGSFQSHSFLKSRKTYPSLTENKLSIGPFVNEQFIQSNQTIEVFSGLTKAQIQISDVYCKNGIIQVITQFLQPAETPLDTISDLAETQYMEEILKSLNVSDTVSGANKTILVPNNEAWSQANGITIPYGTLVHDLYYLSLEGVYFSDQLATGDILNLRTDYKDSDVKVQLKDGKLMVNDIARIVERDFITTSGVMHIIDTVFFADSFIARKKNETTNSNSSEPNNQKTDGSTSTTTLSSDKSDGHICHPTTIVWAFIIVCLILFM
ncbi:FAS1 domain-containing protein [Gilbertella persicaria]|uniref:FAS1 domain-containing protein n=1 Tax=Gilbertella persicaria TaxID=101096 RepID=UPI0022204C78|nr:FAS1 domain-containing protein [Gilbertella persicaria]KAI8087797.1 FAS1 domain-containing protein [Gilbertella persicaria]